MAEVLGGVLGTAVANGSKQRRRTRAAEDSGGGRGGGVVGREKSVLYHDIIALCKATTAQSILCRKGRPDIALHNSINLLNRMT